MVAVRAKPGSGQDYPCGRARTTQGLARSGYPYTHKGTGPVLTRDRLTLRGESTPLGWP